MTTTGKQSYCAPGQGLCDSNIVPPSDFILGQHRIIQFNADGTWEVEGFQPVRSPGMIGVQELQQVQESVVGKDVGK